MKLYSYFRSSAAFRTRIALNLKGVNYEQVAINLRKGEQNGEAFKAINPLGLVPALGTEEGILGQSLAIIEWLDERYPEPAFLPGTSWQKARIRSMAYSIACDIHPLNNLRVLSYIKNTLGADNEAETNWYHHWIHQGFQALETQVEAAPFCMGSQPTLADICLIPQVNNALRFKMDLSPWPKIVSIREHCLSLEEFIQAAPENQPDSVNS